MKPLCHALALACGAAAASQGQVEAGLGHESQTSPLVRIDPQGALVDLGTQQRLRAAHVRVDLQGLLDTAPGAGASLNLAGSAQVRRAPGHGDFDLGVLSLQPGVQWPTAAGSFGLGLQWQRIGAAGSFTRHGRALQLTWTRPLQQGFVTALLERGHQRHGSAFADLDARTGSWMLQRHLPLQGHGVDSLDLAVIGAREHNARGFAELSSRTQLLQATLQGEVERWGWSTGLAWQRVRFGDTAFAGLPPRHDRAWMVDAALSRPLDGGWSLRLSATAQSNRSNTRLYDNRYRLWSLSLRRVL